MKVGICVPVHNALDYTRRVLKQILETTTIDIPLVIIDDCSEAETSDFLKEFVHSHLKKEDSWRSITLFRNERQQLFTRSANRGIRFLSKHLLSEDAVAVVNSDCDLRRGWLDHMIRGMQTIPNLGMIGYRDQPDRVAWSHVGYTEIGYPDYITGHCMLLRYEMLKQIGVLCETDTDGREDINLALYQGQAHIGSERILCWKAMTNGWKCMYSNFPGVFHQAGQSWGHDLNWLHRFELKPLWKPCDTLDDVKWLDN